MKIFFWFSLKLLKRSSGYLCCNAGGMMHGGEGWNSSTVILKIHKMMNIHTCLRVSSFIPCNLFVTSKNTEIDSKHAKINNFELLLKTKWCSIWQYEYYADCKLLLASLEVNQ